MMVSVHPALTDYQTVITRRATIVPVRVIAADYDNGGRIFTGCADRDPR